MFIFPAYSYNSQHSAFKLGMRSNSRVVLFVELINDDVWDKATGDPLSYRDGPLSLCSSRSPMGPFVQINFSCDIKRSRRNNFKMTALLLFQINWSCLQNPPALKLNWGSRMQQQWLDWTCSWLGMQDARLGGRDTHSATHLNLKALQRIKCQQCRCWSIAASDVTNTSSDDSWCTTGFLPNSANFAVRCLHANWKRQL